MFTFTVTFTGLWKIQVAVEVKSWALRFWFPAEIKRKPSFKSIFHFSYPLRSHRPTQLQLASIKMSTSPMETEQNPTTDQNGAVASQRSPLPPSPPPPLPPEDKILVPGTSTLSNPIFLYSIHSNIFN